MKPNINTIQHLDNNELNEIVTAILSSISARQVIEISERLKKMGGRYPGFNAEYNDFVAKIHAINPTSFEPSFESILSAYSENIAINFVHDWLLTALQVSTAKQLSEFDESWQNDRGYMGFDEENDWILRNDKSFAVRIDDYLSAVKQKHNDIVQSNYYYKQIFWQTANIQLSENVFLDAKAKGVNSVSKAVAECAWYATQTSANGKTLYQLAQLQSDQAISDDILDLQYKLYFHDSHQTYPRLETFENVSILEVMDVIFEYVKKVGINKAESVLGSLAADGCDSACRSYLENKLMQTEHDATIEDEEHLMRAKALCLFGEKILASIANDEEFKAGLNKHVMQQLGIALFDKEYWLQRCHYTFNDKISLRVKPIDNNWLPLYIELILKVYETNSIDQLFKSHSVQEMLLFSGELELDDIQCLYKSTTILGWKKVVSIITSHDLPYSSHELGQQIIKFAIANDDTATANLIKTHASMAEGSQPLNSSHHSITRSYLPMESAQQIMVRSDIELNMVDKAILDTLPVTSIVNASIENKLVPADPTLKETYYQLLFSRYDDNPAKATIEIKRLYQLMGIESDLLFYAINQGEFRILQEIFTIQEVIAKLDTGFVAAVETGNKELADKILNALVAIVLADKASLADLFQLVGIPRKSALALIHYSDPSFILENKEQIVKLFIEFDDAVCLDFIFNLPRETSNVHKLSYDDNERFLSQQASNRQGYTDDEIWDLMLFAIDNSSKRCINKFLFILLDAKYAKNTFKSFDEKLLSQLQLIWEMHSIYSSSEIAEFFVSLRDENGKTLIMASAEFGHLAMIDWLAQSQEIAPLVLEEITKPDANAKNAINYAEENNHFNKLQQLFLDNQNYEENLAKRRNEIFAPYVSKRMAIAENAAKREPELEKIFLQLTSLLNKNQYTDYIATVNNFNNKLDESIICRLLQFYASKNNFQIVQFLLKTHQKIDVNFIFADGNTLLYWAIVHENLNAVEALIQHEKIDVNLKCINFGGKSLLSAFGLVCIFKYSSTRKQANMGKIFFDSNKVDFSKKTEDGQNYSHLAIMASNFDIFFGLPKFAPTHLNEVDNRGLTPIMMLLCNKDGDTDLILSFLFSLKNVINYDIILEKDVPEMRLKAGYTYLHIAAMVNVRRYTIYLYEKIYHRCDQRASDNNTPPYLAAMYGNISVCEFYMMQPELKAQHQLLKSMVIQLQKICEDGSSIQDLFEDRECKNLLEYLFFIYPNLRDPDSYQNKVQQTFSGSTLLLTNTTSTSISLLDSEKISRNDLRLRLFSAIDRNDMIEFRKILSIDPSLVKSANAFKQNVYEYAESLAGRENFVKECEKYSMYQPTKDDLGSNVCAPNLPPKPENSNLAAGFETVTLNDDAYEILDSLATQEVMHEDIAATQHLFNSYMQERDYGFASLIIAKYCNKDKMSMIDTLFASDVLEGEHIELLIQLFTPDTTDLFKLFVDYFYEGRKKFNIPDYVFDSFEDKIFMDNEHSEVLNELYNYAFHHTNIKALSSAIADNDQRQVQRILRTHAQLVAIRDCQNRLPVEQARFYNKPAIAACIQQLTQRNMSAMQKAIKQTYTEEISSKHAVNTSSFFSVANVRLQTLETNEIRQLKSSSA